jgi:hypothetical protein
MHAQQVSSKCRHGSQKFDTVHTGFGGAYAKIQLDVRRCERGKLPTECKGRGGGHGIQLAQESMTTAKC